MDMTKVLAFLLTLTVVATGAMAAEINEIRIDNSGGDTDEYFELAGMPGESLDGLTYIVIGDGTGGSGVIENVTDLTGLSLMDDGILSVHKEGTVGTCGGYDLDLPLNFENSDNVTHLLVAGFTGADGDDLDADDDGVLDMEPWDSVVDCVALVENLDDGELVYCDTQVGPDGTFVPGQVFRCDEGWRIGSFDLCVDDTPGEPNDAACESVSTESQSWSGVKGLYR
jgi:hypothetical protein